MAYLVKVHEMGKIPIEMKTDTEGNLICDKAKEGSSRQQSRDGIVRIKKNQQDLNPR